jgi:hypothetical protein
MFARDRLGIGYANIEHFIKDGTFKLNLCLLMRKLARAQLIPQLPLKAHERHFNE